MKEEKELVLRERQLDIESQEKQAQINARKVIMELLLKKL